MPHHVQALFCVTNHERNDRGEPLVRLSATYSTRDGQRSEINARFNTATPGGRMELSREFEGVPLLQKGEYVLLDLYDPPESAPAEPAEGTIRTVWWFSKLEITAHTHYAQFVPTFYPRAGRGVFDLTINNLGVADAFDLKPGAAPRPFVVDLSRG